MSSSPKILLIEFYKLLSENKDLLDVLNINNYTNIEKY